VLTTLKLFVDLCLIRAKPQDLPYSFFLMLATIITYLGAEFLMVSAVHAPLKATVISVMDTAMLLGFTYAGLWVKSIVYRGIKTVAAVAGSGTLIKLCHFGALTAFNGFGSANPTAAVKGVALVVLIWKVLVIGAILRSAMTLPLWGGIGIAVLYVYTSTRFLAVLTFL
jgi:hypothetical protein